MNQMNQMNTKDISKQVITLGKKYKTRSGQAVEVLKIDLDGEYSVVAAIDNLNVITYFPNGSMSAESESDVDLIEEPLFKEGDLVQVQLDDGKKVIRRFVKETEEYYKVYNSLNNKNYFYDKRLVSKVPEDFLMNLSIK